ncbi:adenylyltransferase/cytidyltransferase family protein [Maribellus comscasis]|uniref:Adenylyltransferase/cytidyltransferase family protein n=1 Tax=Maribellus comscasis TaxID=2681766 RepID=A0A6I6JW87_9BACT|nr:adenylyltransferase/cytidyltransferase family protein [Maribellus comscasis]QGY44402.1 adenylyltransferase/cytidyltransferase family protein [Maribellus comscasis]
MDTDIQTKIFSGFQDFKALVKKWKADNEIIVFTNGCFDVIHHGHVDSLEKSAQLGTKLIVGLNSDESVRLLKGFDRPVMDEKARAIILAAFGFVDAVILFSEETPAKLVAQINPNVLVKGKQYEVHEIAGHDTVLKNGGKVITLDLVPGVSTSDIIQKIKSLK